MLFLTMLHPAPGVYKTFLFCYILQIGHSNRTRRKARIVQRAFPEAFPRLRPQQWKVPTRGQRNGQTAYDQVPPAIITIKPSTFGYCQGNLKIMHLCQYLCRLKMIRYTYRVAHKYSTLVEN